MGKHNLSSEQAAELLGVSIKTLSRYTTKKSCPFKWAVDRKTGRRVKRFDSEEISSWQTMFTTISEGGPQRFLEILREEENKENEENHDKTMTSNVYPQESPSSYENEHKNRRAGSGEAAALLKMVEILEKQIEIKDQMIADLLTQIRAMTPRQLEYTPGKTQVIEQLSVGEQLANDLHASGLSPEKIVSKLKKKGMSRYFDDKITLKKIKKILLKNE